LMDEIPIMTPTFARYWSFSPQAFGSVAVGRFQVKTPNVFDSWDRHENSDNE
jgi:hypothetical protein